MSYVLVLVFPAALLVVYALFRWRYVLAIRKATYSPVSRVPDFDPRGPLDPTPSPLALRWAETDDDSRPAPVELAVASEITRDVRSRLVAAGGAYLVIAAILTWQGWQTLGPRAAISLAYANTLPSLFIILAFCAPGWRSWALAATLWIAAYLLLLVGPLGVSSKTAIAALYGGVDFTSYAVLALVPLVLRVTRPLLVGFVPAMSLLLGVVALFAVVMNTLGIDIEALHAGLSVKTVGLSLTALACGLTVSVWQIRNDPGRLVLLRGIPLAEGTRMAA